MVGSNNQMGLQQMVMGGQAVQGGTTVDEMVRYKVDELLDQYEDRKIVYTQEREAELKELEQERKETIAQLAEDAEDELDYIREKIKHEIKASMEGGLMSEEYRKQEI